MSTVKMVRTTGLRGVGGVFWQMLFGNVMHYIDGLGGRQQGDTGAVAEEPEVAVVGDDVDGRCPGVYGGAMRRLGGCS